MVGAGVGVGLGLGVAEMARVGSMAGVMVVQYQLESTCMCISVYDLLYFKRL